MQKIEIIKQAQELAINSLKNFIKNLDLNEEEFDYIENIPILLGKTENKKHEAEYYHYTNSIIVDNSYLDDYLDKINRNLIDERRIITHYAKTIAHEMIHASRTILRVGDKKEKDKINIISEFYHKTDNPSSKYKKERILNQNYFEEVITETIANIVILSRNDRSLNLENINEIIQKHEQDQDIKIGSQIINNMGIDLLRWFMTAAYESQYYDKFEKTFNDKYDEFLKNISKIYNKTTQNKSVSIKLIEETEKIVNEKTGKNKSK